LGGFCVVARCHQQTPTWTGWYKKAGDDEKKQRGGFWEKTRKEVKSFAKPGEERDHEAQSSVDHVTGGMGLRRSGNFYGT